MYKFINKTLCTEVGGDLWIPDNEQNWDARRAVEVCHRCPAKLECLSKAMNDPSLVGIWGGTTTSQRVEMRAKKRKQESA